MPPVPHPISTHLRPEHRSRSSPRTSERGVEDEREESLGGSGKRLGDGKGPDLNTLVPLTV